MPGSATRSPVPKTSRPAPSSERPSSLPEQSIPSDVTPFILRRPISMPPGSTLPTGASGTRSPCEKFHAPQTTCTSRLPASTVTRLMRSAPGIAAISVTSDHHLGKTFADLLYTLHDEAEVVEHTDEVPGRTERGEVS